MLEAFGLNRSRQSVTAKANHLGLKRPQIRAVPEGFKYCPSCDSILSISDFHRQVGKPDNLRAHCKWCRMKNSVKKITNVSSDQMNKYTICRTEKSLNEFGRNKNMKDGYANQCKICVSKKTRK